MQNNETRLLFNFLNSFSVLIISPHLLDCAPFPSIVIVLRKKEKGHKHNECKKIERNVGRTLKKKKRYFPLSFKFILYDNIPVLHRGSYFRKCIAHCISFL